MFQSESIGNLALALSKAQGEIDGANKSSDNPFFKSKYADLHECIQAAKAPLAKNDLAVIQTLESLDNKILIHTTLAHKSGEWIKGILEMEPKKNDDQGRGSSITYGRRYSYAAIVGIAQKDDDGNASSGRSKKGTQTNDGKQNIQRLEAEWCAEADANAKTIKTLEAWYKINKLVIAELPEAARTKINGYVSELKDAISNKSS